MKLIIKSELLECNDETIIDCMEELISCDVIALLIDRKEKSLSIVDRDLRVIDTEVI